MDTRNGRILTLQDLILTTERHYAKPMYLMPTPLQLAKMRVGRNDPCPCASGKKFKKCCLLKTSRVLTNE